MEFHKISRVMIALAEANPEATSDELYEMLAERLEGRTDNPYGVTIDEDEPVDHAFNDLMVRES
jgi:hypothetical protein